jgi:hypothetical protein
VTEPDQPDPAETAVAMLRDITGAVVAVAGRLYDLPPEGAG